MKSERLALFDFDGTITTKDTLFLFCRFLVGDVRFIVGLILLLPVLVGQRVKLISAQRAKEILLTYFIRKMKATEFDLKCQHFALQVLPRFIRSQASKTILNFKQEGVRVIIVSASPQNWIIPWAHLYGIEVIATRLQVKDDNITGKILGKNCNGIEKVIRIKKVLTLSHYQHISAYGDSSGDLPMLDLARHRFFKPFR